MGDMAPELEDGEIEESPPRYGRAVIVGLAAPGAPASSGKAPEPIEGTPGSPLSNAGQPINKWHRVVNLVPSNSPRALFKGGLGSSTLMHLDGRVCSDPGFMALIHRRYEELYSEKLNPARVPAYLAKICYAEFFLKLELDYPAIQSSREQALERRNRRLKEGSSPAERLVQKSLRARQTIAKRLVVPRRARSMSGTSSLVVKQLKLAQKELQQVKSKCQEAEARAAKAEKLIASNRLGTMQKIGLVATPLEELRGEPLTVSMEQETGVSDNDNQCSVCFQLFTSEGRYQLGCGHYYHVQCLLLHAFCSCSCFVCEGAIPRELYLTFGQEDNMPEPEPGPAPDQEPAGL